MIMEQNEHTGERTLEQIEADIERTKAELESVHGTETEVYARIVGYYRAVKNWNKGKRDEYEMRKLFSIEESRKESFAEESSAPLEKVQTAPQQAEVSHEANLFDEEDQIPASYELYFREVCPNCPPVKQYLSGVDMKGSYVDVDTESGLEKAASQGVFSTPTAIFRNAYGKEIGRAHCVEELNAILKKEAVLA
mgnify:FL=1